jgi:hypothetical protein
MSEPLREHDRPDEHDATPDSDASSTDAAEDTVGPELGPPTAIESLIAAILEAGPDVTEHVVKAAQELLLAVQVVVDAADRAVNEQRTVRDTRARSSDDEPGRDDSVRHLDLAE